MQNPSEKMLGFFDQNFALIEEKKAQKIILLGWRKIDRFCHQPDCSWIWAHSCQAKCTW